MNRISTSFFILLCFISVNAIAEIESSGQIDFSNIEEEERRQIISDLTYRLDTKFTCAQTLNWDDGGSGADLDGYFYIPSAGQSEYIIGGYATQKKSSSNSCVLTVSEPPNNPQGTPRLLIAPIDWKMIWKDKGSGARKDGSMWEAIPPDSNYRCLGSISQLGYDQKPNLPNYRCVHSSLTDKVVANSIIWSDKGSGADKEVTIFRLPNTSSFITVPARISKIKAYDLKANASGEPDPQIVDAILSKRMKEIKTDIETQINAKLEQMKKEEEQKRLAEKADQKRLAEEAEKKRLATDAEQKRLAEEEERKRLAEEAEQKRLAEEADQRHLFEEKQKKDAEEAEQKRLAEELKQKTLAEGPNKIKETVTSNEIASTDDNNKSSKNLTDLIIFFIGVILSVFGLIIFLVIVFKFTIGSKKKDSKTEHKSH
jgi:hypothetical protein